jgi:hypothetical protein
MVTCARANHEKIEVIKVEKKREGMAGSINVRMNTNDKRAEVVKHNRPECVAGWQVHAIERSIVWSLSPSARRLTDITLKDKK